MTTEERMEIIRNKAKKNKEDELTKKAQEEIEWGRLYTEIYWELSARVKAILRLATECGKSKVKIPRSERLSMREDAAKPYGYDAEFFAEGIRHHVGLFLENPCERFDNNYPINFKGIGIVNGGANGPVDIYTDGNGVYGRDSDKGKMCSPRTEDMKKFLKEFPVFEQAFYNWIDSLA